MREFDIDMIYEEQTSLILGTCFWEDKMPLGLVTSPVLSDVYLKEFDDEIVNELGENYVYTRYADDILVSSADIISEPEELRIRELIKDALGRIGLKLNENKYKRSDLLNEGNYIKYLGLNIVRTKNGNMLSVGKSYKNYIAKSYLKYIVMDKDNNPEEKFYFGKQIAGYLSFVKMIEGEYGL